MGAVVAKIDVVDVVDGADGVDAVNVFVVAEVIVIAQAISSYCGLFRPAVHQRSFRRATGQPIA